MAQEGVQRQPDAALALAVAPVVARAVAVAAAVAGALAVGLIMSAPLTAQTPAPLMVELEAGPMWQLRNVAQAPTDDTGTRFSVHDLTGAGPRTAWRIAIGVDVDERHGLRALFAPLSLSATTMLQEPMDFGGQQFDAGPATWIRYASSAFRGTYRFRLAGSARTDMRVGLSAEIRDAAVTLEQQGITRSSNDLGFAPLLHLAGEWRPGNGWRVGGEADAITLGSRRTIDASARVLYQPGQRWSAGLGYRILEGGFETPQAHSFAWFHSLAAILAYRF